MSAKRVTYVVAMLALSGTVVLIWQRHSLAAARLRNQEDRPLQTPSSAVTQAADEPELAAWREQTKDLPRLRNEVTQLRTRKAEVDAARQEHEQLLQASRDVLRVPREAPPGFIAKEQLRNAGFATPEAAVETFFWAMRESRLDLMVQCLSPEHRDRKGFESLPEETREKQIKSFQAEGMGDRRSNNFSDFTVTDRQQLSEDTVVLSLRSSVGLRAAQYRLKRTGTEWKIDDLPL